MYKFSTIEFSGLWFYMARIHAIQKTYGLGFFPCLLFIGDKIN